MGVDLKILPQYNKTSKFSKDVLLFHRNRELFELIAELEINKGIEAKEPFGTYIGKVTDLEETYGDAFKTPYGSIINSVKAIDLYKVLDSYNVIDYRNKAIKNYLAYLPKDLEIWLYWH